MSRPKKQKLIQSFALKSGHAFHKIDPEMAGTELERIWKENGEMLMPKTVVAEARPAAAPLHPAFEWSDSVAAERYREHQARALIRAVVLIEDSKPRQPLFIHVPLQKTSQGRIPPHYQHAKILPQKTLEYEGALREMKRKLTEAQLSYEAVRRLAEETGSEHLERMALIAEALATAKSLSDHLQ